MPDTGYESIRVQPGGTASDVDGNIVRYQWDFEGDGVFDHDSAAGPAVQHTYYLRASCPGTYRPTLLVTDDTGHRGIANRGTGDLLSPLSSNSNPLHDLHEDRIADRWTTARTLRTRYSRISTAINRATSAMTMMKVMRAPTSATPIRWIHPCQTARFASRFAPATT